MGTALLWEGAAKRTADRPAEITVPHPAQVFDLGSDGKAAPSKVAESGDFLADAARALGGRDVFGRGGALLDCR